MIRVSCEVLNRLWEKEGERINDEVEIPPLPPPPRHLLSFLCLGYV